MHFSLTPIVLLIAGIAQASAIAVRATTGCAGAIAIETKMLGVVNYTTYSCASPVVTTDLTGHPAPRARSALEERQFDACTTGYPECQSTILCNSDYCSGTRATAPYASDCLVITNALEGAAGTFFVNPQTYTSLAYGSCEYRWGNVGSTLFEYSLYNWGSLGAVIYNNCISVYGYGRGTCISSNGLWFAETVVPGSPL